EEKQLVFDDWSARTGAELVLPEFGYGIVTDHWNGAGISAGIWAAGTSSRSKVEEISRIQGAIAQKLVYRTMKLVCAGLCRGIDDDAIACELRAVCVRQDLELR